MSEDTTFEQALKSLEEAVAKLEKGQMPLDEALDCFEVGSAKCQPVPEKTSGG